MGEPGAPQLQDPGPAVQSLIFQGRRVLAQMESTNPGPLLQKVGRDVGHELARGVLEGLGLPKSWARPATKAVARNAVHNRTLHAETMYASWADSVIQALGGFSVAESTLKMAGNSQRQIKRFSRTRTVVKLQSRLRKGLAYLEGLAGQALVFNSDLLALLKWRQSEKAAEKLRVAELRLLDIPELAPGLDALRFPNRASLHQQLASFPDERAMIEGAMDAFLGDAQDRYRHAVAGARSALESMGRRVTGSADWKKEIERRTNRETAKMFTSTYQLMSSFTHAGRVPTKPSAELALKQAIGLAVWLANHASSFKPPPPAGRSSDS